ncbi:MAG: DUF1343 domain-containing protein [Ignavibacteria bacterium]|nr:DUF1343 domain-containing protein [Ignavibacteria bacterium]
MSAARTLAFLACALCLTASARAQSRVATGADVLLRDSLSLIRGARVGVVCNRASTLGDGVPVWEALRAEPSCTLAAIFTPEHGLDAAADNGREVPDTLLGNVPVYSLYGGTRKPRPHMLRGIDVLLIDLQDAGARFYTYASTLLLCMEAAAAQEIRCIVLDRPNPIGGDIAEGPVLDTALRSFVGMLPVPIRHGMTLGELARMAAGEGWFAQSDRLLLTVVPMRGWRRAMHFSDTGLRWTAPSPSMRTPETAEVYPGICLFEGTNVSEGRGTASPFLRIGAPFMDANEVASRFAALHLPGVDFEPAVFVPSARAGASAPKHAGDTCRGAALRVRDARAFQSVRTGVMLLAALREMYGARVTATPFLDMLAGVRGLFDRLRATRAAAELVASWDEALAAFLRLRAPYLLYNA